MANSWGESGTTWSQGDWGQQNVTTVFPTGFSVTSTLNSAGVTAFNEQGWGSDAWGDENWGESGITVSPTGFSITATLGDLAYAGSIEGWGRDEWGYGNWGENTTTVILDGLEMTTGLGEEGWGRSTWGNDAWGEESVVNIEIGESLTGLSITGSLGTPQINYDFKHILTDSFLGTLSLGSLSINNGADHTQGLGGLAATMSLGTLTVADVVQGTGSFLVTGTLASVVVGELTPVALTGIGATAALGSLESIPDMARGLTGLSSTMSLGSLAAIDNMQVGVSGFGITGTLNALVSPLHYKDDTITGYTAYVVDTHAG